MAMSLFFQVDFKNRLMSNLRNGPCHVDNIFFSWRWAICRMSILRNDHVALSNFKGQGPQLSAERGTGMGELLPVK